MLSLIFYIIFNIPNHAINTGEPSLDVALIPDSLLINAHAVVRYEHTLCEIKSLTKKVISKEKAVTILDEKGNLAGIVAIQYTDKEDKIKNLEIEIYNAKGEIIKKVKKKEINDLSVYDGFSIAGDERQKYYSFTTNEYPYTMKYVYEEESTNTLWIPSWFPISSTGISVQDNKYEIFSYDPEYKLLHKNRNIEGSAIQINTDKHHYQATNIRAIKYEPKAPPFQDYIPMVRIMPTKFSYFGIEGSFSDWTMYGKWMYDNMLKGRGDLPQSLISELDEMIPKGSTKDEIARIVYDYVTESTRYVSVQLGVGGYMPFTSTDVYDLKYGDCKALSFYTSNILKHYDIEAIYTEIMSERDYALGYDSDIPGPGQGNHIVLCLPNEGDTTWLECTSNSYFFGYAHSSIDNRQALMITPEGGKLITTTKYSSKENLAEKNARITIGEDNAVQIDFENTYHNQRHEPWLSLLKEKDKKRDDLLRAKYFDHLPTYELNSYEISADEKQKFIKEAAHIQIKNLIEKAGDYIILPYMVEYINKPSILNLNRSQGIYIKNGRTDAIKIEISIPDGYKLIEKEKDLNFKNTFGSLEVKKENIDASIYRISVDIEYNEGTFGPQMALEYNLFVESLGEVINDKLIFKPI